MRPELGCARLVSNPAVQAHAAAELNRAPEDTVMRPQRPHCPARAPQRLAAPGTPANRPTEHLGVQPQPDPRLAAPFPTATGCAATPPPDNCARTKPWNAFRKPSLPRRPICTL